MNYLLDTNILVHFVRGTQESQQILKKFSLSNQETNSIISVVSLGEIQSLAIRNNWGEKRLTILNSVLAQFLIADIHSEDVIMRYAEIDAFSQGKLPGKPLGTSSRNMSKNDIWIAATASILDAILLTTDRDFLHLQGNYLQIQPVSF
jgi:predicted nucleic acid-binding protein